MPDLLKDLDHLFLGSRLKRLADRLQADAVRINRSAGLVLQPPQVALLAAIDRYGPLGVGEAAEALGVSQPAVTRTAAQLVEFGLLSAGRDEADLRQKTLTLSDAGRDAIARVGRIAWPRIDAAVRDLCAALPGDFMEQITMLEAELDRASLIERAESVAAGDVPGDLSIREYSDDLADDFHRINAEWIEQMFALEENDRKILSDPRGTIIDRGGVILFVESAELGVIGTCALIRTEEGCYELTKMGVSERARGRKAGEFLLRAMLDRAGEMGIETLYLLTNARCAPAIHLYEKLGFAHDAGIMARFGSRYARCDVAMLYRGARGEGISAS